MVKSLIDQLVMESVGKIPFRQLRTIKDFGMVVLGAGGDPQEWVDGIAGILKEKGIVDPNVETFSSAAIITGNVMDLSDEELIASDNLAAKLLDDRGRTDLLLVFNPESKPNVGKLAMWRLQFGDISWVDDFVVNYAKDYRR